MRKSGLLPILTLFPLVLLCGCQELSTRSSAKPAPAPRAAQPNAVQNNALDLLCDLLGDEKNLSKLLIIKKVSPAVKQLIKDISNTAANDLKTIQTWRGTNRPPAKLQLGLPSGEMATRDAISKTKQHELLHASGAELEFQLLLTQVEALNYGKHLALVISENGQDATRSQQASAIGQELNHLREQALARLKQR